MVKKKAKKRLKKAKTVTKKKARKERPARKARKVKKSVKKKAKKTRQARTAKPARKAKKATTTTPSKIPVIGTIRLPDTIKETRITFHRPAPSITDFTKKPKPSEIEKIIAMISDVAHEVSATEATKFDIGIPHDGAARFEQELSSEYGTDRVVLLTVDPNFVFTYWEVKNESLQEATKAVGPDGKLTLRFYDVGSTSTPEQSNFWDVEVFDRTGNWYLKLSHPEQHLCLDIGLKNSTGYFHKITRSNLVRLPSQSLAKPGPIKWMIVSPSGDKIVSDVEEYTDADLALLKKILGPYFYDLLMRGRLASIAGSSVEAVFYEVDHLKLGASPSGSPPWTKAR
ncbi:MAG: DUF4912 domain-containing protein [Pseudomonadota bacterium]